MSKVENPHAGCGCGCGCAAGAEENGDWTPEKKGPVAFLIGTGVSMLGYGGYVVARRRPKWLPLWLAALATWFTVCKYLICARCEFYGEPCDFYWLGRYAARLFERQPDRTLDAAGMIAEGASVAVLQALPALAALGNWRMLVKFLILLGLNQATQLRVCCRRCVLYSRDPWKRETCPSYRIARTLFGR